MAKKYILLSDINTGEKIFKAGTFSDLKGVPENEIPSLILNKVVQEATEENIVQIAKTNSAKAPEPALPSKASKEPQKISGDDSDLVLTKDNLSDKYDGPKRGRPSKKVE